MREGLSEWTLLLGKGVMMVDEHGHLPEHDDSERVRVLTERREKHCGILVSSSFSP